MLPESQQLSTRFRAAHLSHLRHMAIFALVADTGSFTITAQRLGIGKSSISRHVSDLENYLGAKLLNRSTRALALTDAGRLILPECTKLIENTVSAFDKLDGDLALAGTLRIASTVEHGQYVLPPIVSSFTKANPNLDVDLVLGDGFVDLVDRGIDIAIRVGSPGPSPQNISKKIAEFDYQLYAHRDFLKKHDPLETPHQAAHLPWLLNANSPNRHVWTFEKDGKKTTIKATSRVISNAFNARIELAKQGDYLIGVPSFIPSDFLTPPLVPVLTEYKIVPKYAIYAVYADARFLSPKVSEFLKLLNAQHP